MRRNDAICVDELAMHADEGVDHQRLVHGAAPRAQDVERRSSDKRRAVRAVGRERVEAVDDRKNPRADRNIRADDAPRVPGAVPVLMMAAHDRHHGIRKFDERQNVGADVDVALHLLELGFVQFAGLVEDVFRGLTG